jgi:hypothetical protein
MLAESRLRNIRAQQAFNDTVGQWLSVGCGCIVALISAAAMALVAFAILKWAWAVVFPN